MKINKVLLPVNNNKTYTCFWNIVSFVWKSKFNITPVLIFYGSVEEFNSNNFDFTYGEYIILDKVENIPIEVNDWVPTWSIIFASSLFENEVCMTSGIDQIPISDFFLKKIEEIEDVKFVVGLSDAYKNYKPNTLGYFNMQTNIMYPTSHLVGLGSTFNKIFNISENWTEEINKLYNNRHNYHLTFGNWGLDECYSSEKISKYEIQNDIYYMDFFWDHLFSKRIDLDVKQVYNLEMVKKREYSELTTKNFYKFENQIKEIVNNIGYEKI
jgi:hypothetical protein